MADSNSTRIPALWFTATGAGPDHMALELAPLAAEFGGRIPATLGLRVRAPGLVIGADARAMVDGGLLFDRASVEQLWQQLGAWLDANKPSEVS